MKDRLAEISRLKDHISALTAFVQSEAIAREDRDRDLLALALGAKVCIRSDLAIVTKHPIADDSHDHRFPRGTVNDNTRHPRFVRACEPVFGPYVQHLDLG